MKLTKEQELSLVREYKASGSQAIKEQLVLGTLTTLYPFINKFHGDIKEDLKQEAVASICHALDLFEPRGDCRFSTYAYMFAKKYICRYVESNNSQTNNESLEKLSKTPIDTQYEDLYQSIDNLVPEERDVLQRIYFLDENVTKIATDWGHKSRRWTYDTKIKAIAHLKEQLLENRPS